MKTLLLSVLFLINNIFCSDDINIESNHKRSFNNNTVINNSIVKKKTSIWVYIGGGVVVIIIGGGGYFIYHEFFYHEIPITFKQLQVKESAPDKNGVITLDIQKSFDIDNDIDTKINKIINTIINEDKKTLEEKTYNNYQELIHELTTNNKSYNIQRSYSNNILPAFKTQKEDLARLNQNKYYLIINDKIMKNNSDIPINKLHITPFIIEYTLLNKLNNSSDLFNSLNLSYSLIFFKKNWKNEIYGEKINFTYYDYNNLIKYVKENNKNGELQILQNTLDNGQFITVIQQNFNNSSKINIGLVNNVIHIAH